MLPPARGNKDVSSAAKAQCVKKKLPRACPFARYRFGKYLRDIDQIVTPCPTACAAINAKIRTGIKL